LSILTITNCDIYDGDGVIPDASVVIEGSRIAAVGPRGDIRGSGTELDLGGQSLASGFIDVQVNGGGDILFNDVPTVDGIQRIVNAHATFGTTSVLPTFITGPFERMGRARDAVVEFIRSSGSSVLGIHFEGPAISANKLGVHNGTYAVNDFPLAMLPKLQTARVLVTLAPEAVPGSTIAELRRQGVIVAIGHSEATYEQAAAAVDEGASLVTHLYNAMSALTSREPGVVGLTFADPRVYASVIVDGYHAHFASIAAAWRAKPAGRLFLVTDAMPPVGGSAGGYVLGPWEVTVRNGKCTTPDGTLAGSALDMATAVRNCIQRVGIPKDEALRMASLYPAQFLGVDDHLGRVRPGHVANLVAFDNELHVHGVVVDGVPDARLQG
jgi:N-acetylglucosamine-6-phosphate deacetylase